jgi:hypothetical protein
MSKHTDRRARARARTIEAHADRNPIHADAVPLEWIAAADAAAEPAKPKRFSMTAYTGGPMQVSSYGPPVVIDLAGLTAKAPIPILRDHDLGRVAGHADEVQVEGAALKLAGLVSGAGPDAREIVDSAANGFPWKASVGVRPDKLEFVGEGISTKVNGKTLTGPLYVARKSTLREVSIVAIGADPKAKTTVAASDTYHHEESNMNFEQWIEAMGLSMEDLRDDQVAKLQAKYDVELKAAETDPDRDATAPKVQPPHFDVDAIGLAYAQHEAGIEAVAVEYAERVDPVEHRKFVAAARKAAIQAKAKALTDQWAAPRLEAEYIKAAATFEADLMVAERPKGPAIHASSRDAEPKVIEAALRMGCMSPEKKLLEEYGDQVLEAAYPLRRIGLKETIHLVCAMDGRPAPAIGSGQSELIRAAFSTASVATLLSNVANKTMIESYKAVNSVARLVARKLTANDFKTHTGVKLTGDFKMKEVGPDGMLKHATAADSSFTYRVATYGRMFGLTRQIMQNDDVGAFAEIPRMIGRGAALALEEAFWTLVLANTGSYFHSNNANLITAVLGSAGLGTASQTLEDQTDEDGNPVLIMGRYLVVPTALRVTATELNVSQKVVGPSTSKTPDANIWQGRYEPAVTPYLGNTSFHASASSTAWYLFADPADVAAFGIGYLNGVETPVVEDAPLAGDFLGQAWRGYLDFGVCQVDKRGAVKSTGAGA